MSSVTPYLPPALHTLDELLTTKRLPELDCDQMSALSGYLFHLQDKSLRIRVAEIAYQNHDDPRALDLFLSCAMPIAQKWAERKAERLFVYPSAWQLECMYNGAVNALIAMFQRPVNLHPMPDSFRRYLYRSMLKGACAEYFRREENGGIFAVEHADRLTASKEVTRTAEEELITRDLLEQISHYPLLRRALSKTLECIVELGPDLALREHITSERQKIMRQARPMLDAEMIAKARGIKPSALLQQIFLARAVIRKAFNGDGRLFLTH